MNYILISFAGDGDVLPLVSLGRALMEHHNQVTLLALPVYAELACQNGLGFVAIEDDESWVNALRRKWVLATRYAGLYAEQYCVLWNCRAYRAICDLGGAKAVVIAVDRPNLWADLYARASLGSPVIRVQLDLPFVADVTGQAVYLPEGGVQRRLAERLETRWKQRMAFAGWDTGHLRIERLWRSVRRTIPSIGLWPSWILGEWAAGCTTPTFGFLPPPACQRRVEELPASVLSRQRLVVFVAGTMGTTRWWAQQFFETSAKICSSLNCGGVFLGGDSVAALRPSWSSEPIVHRQCFPLRQALSRASAVVHHGGIGTAAAAIECGVPQVIVPRVFAQPCNAEWLRRLGLCCVLDSKSYTETHGAAAIEEVLGNRRYRIAAQDYANRCNSEANLRSLCDYLEQPSVTSPIGVVSHGVVGKPEAEIMEIGMAHERRSAAIRAAQ